MNLQHDSLETLTERTNGNELLTADISPAAAWSEGDVLLRRACHMRACVHAADCEKEGHRSQVGVRGWYRQPCSPLCRSEHP